jgi:alpha/beta superfamily hydrolase
MNERPFEIVSGGLRLEGRLHEDEGRLAAVVLHPHPQYGGDMHNHVVAAICETLAESGATTLRFNFRGTGRSEGAFDNGRGEADDARAAIDSLREIHPDARVLLAGYSFGAMVAAGVAADSGVDALVLVSPPVGMAAMPAAPPGLRTLVMTGDRDPVSPAARVAALVSTDVRVCVVPGVDHGWWPGVDQLASELRSFEAALAL